MQKVTSNVWTDTTLRGCNPSMVITNDGVVIIDTPQLPTKAVAMREEAESHGRDPLRHQHRAPRRPHLRQLLLPRRRARSSTTRASTTTSWRSPRPSTPSTTRTRPSRPTTPRARPSSPTARTYFADPNKGHIVFTGDLTLRVGDHTFELLHTPGTHARARSRCTCPRSASSSPATPSSRSARPG